MTHEKDDRFCPGEIQLQGFFAVYLLQILQQPLPEIRFKGNGISAAHEKIVRDLFKGKLQRGKIEIVFDLFQHSPRQWDIKLNTGLLQEIMDKIVPLQEKYGRGLNLSLDSLLKLPMVFHLDYNLDRLRPRTKLTLKIGRQGIRGFLASRSQEGMFIRPETCWPASL